MKMDGIQADLRFTLPLKAGQYIVVLGRAPALVGALAASGLLAVMIYPAEGRDRGADESDLSRCSASGHEPLPLGDSSIDHVIIPELTPCLAGWIPGEVVRVLKPGGSLGLGFNNQSRLGGLLSSRKRRRPGLEDLSGSTIDRWLNQHDLHLTASYGVWSDLQQPRFLVPLNEEAPITYFFSHLFSPYSWAAAVARPIASLATRLGWQQALFPHLYVVAQAN